MVVMRIISGNLGRFEHNGIVAYFVAQDVTQVNGVTHRTPHTQYHIALFDGEVDHQDGFAIIGSTELFGEGVDFVHELDGVVIVVKHRDVKADDMLWAAGFGGGWGGCWFGR